MKKPSIYGNNCSVEIIPVSFIESLDIENSLASILLKQGVETYPIDAVSNTINPSVIIQHADAGDIYSVSLSFRISYINAETTMLLQTLKGYGSLLAKYRTPGKEMMLMGTDQYPVFLTYTNPENFDGYEVTLSGTQDTPPAFIEA